RAGPDQRRPLRGVLARAAGPARDPAPDPQRLQGAGPALQRVRRAGDLEPQEPAGVAEVTECGRVALLPARGGGQEPGATSDRRDVAARTDRATARHSNRGHLVVVFDTTDGDC